MAGKVASCVEADAVVGDFEGYKFGVTSHLYLYIACAGMLDGVVRRLLDNAIECLLHWEWDGRFAPQWGEFSPGALVLHAAVRRALEDSSFDEFDWMRGQERFKSGASNDVVPAQHLLAWSSPASRRLMESPNQLRTALARLKDRYSLLQRAWEIAKAYRVRRSMRVRGDASAPIPAQSGGSGRHQS